MFGSIRLVANAVLRDGMNPQCWSYTDRIASLIELGSFQRIFLDHGSCPRWRSTDMAEIESGNSCLNGCLRALFRH